MVSCNSNTVGLVGCIQPLTNILRLVTNNLELRNKQNSQLACCMNLDFGVLSLSEINYYYYFFFVIVWRLQKAMLPEKTMRSYSLYRVLQCIYQIPVPSLCKEKCVQTRSLHKTLLHWSCFMSSRNKADAIWRKSIRLINTGFSVINEDFAGYFKLPALSQLISSVWFSYAHN